MSAGRGWPPCWPPLNLLKHERRASWPTVRDYNQDIAEYAVRRHAGRNASDRRSVSKLILTPEPAAAPRRAAARAAAAPAPLRSRRPDGRRALDAEQAKTGRTAHYQPTIPCRRRTRLGVYQGLLEVDAPSACRSWPTCCTGTATCRPMPGSPPRWPIACARCAGTADWRGRRLLACPRAGGPLPGTERTVEQLNALPAIAIGTARSAGHRRGGVRAASRAPQRRRRCSTLTWHCRRRIRIDAARAVDSIEPWLATGHGAAVGPIRRFHAGARPSNSRRSFGPSYCDCTTEAGRAGRRRHSGRHPSRRTGQFARNGEEPSTPKTRPTPRSPTPLDVARRAIVRQNRANPGLSCSDLTGYNIAIARYALATWPAGISNDELVKKLVIARNTRRDT